MLLRLLNWWLERQNQRLIEENHRLTEALREAYDGGPIPFTRAEIAKLRASRDRANIDSARARNMGLLDLDQDVIEVDD